jgi:hypothetical protein
MWGSTILRKPFYVLALLGTLLSACGSPNPLALQMQAVPPATVETVVSFYINKYDDAFDLEPRPQGGTREVAEAYLQRYQPGVEPRVFQSSVVYDREGRVLAEIFDEGRRTWVPLSRVSPYLLDAVIATEDGSFYQNEGIDPRRLIGAMVQNAQGDGVVAGASTITMQLARMLFLPPDERFSRSLDRKINEVLLAQDLTRLYTKDEILELYLNLAYFGRGAHVLWQNRRRFKSRRGFAAGRSAPTARTSRPVYQPGRRQRSPADCAGLDGAARLHLSDRGRRCLC